MNKICMAMIQFLCIATFASDEKPVQYKPFTKAIYSIEVSEKLGADDILSDVYIVTSSQEEKGSKEFTLRFSEIQRNTSYIPSGDTYGYAYEYNASGLIWNKCFRASQLFRAMPLERLFDPMVTFPLFDGKSRVKIGDEINIRLDPPITYSRDPQTYGLKFFKSIPLRQKVVGIEKMLGYECLKIKYSIQDSEKVGLTGPVLNLQVDGTVYFAIKEGVVVSDISEAKQDIIIADNKYETIHYKKKIRLLDYEK